MSDSVNQWFTNDPRADVVSIQFGQFQRTIGEIVVSVSAGRRESELRVDERFTGVPSTARQKIMPKVDASIPDPVGNDNDRPGLGRWWVVLWCIWGALVGGLILWLDRNPLTAGVWTVGGIVCGLNGRRILHATSGHFFEYYRRLRNDGEVSTRVRRIARLAWNHQIESEDCQRLIHEEAEESTLSAALIIPPLVALLWGTLLGAIIGALIPLDSDINLTGLALNQDPGVPASIGALLGVISTSVLLSCVLSVAMPFIVPIPRHLARRTQLKWRLLMLISPLLFFPAVGYAIYHLVLERLGRERSERWA